MNFDLYSDVVQLFAIFFALSSSVLVGVFLNVRNQALSVCVMSHAMLLVYASMIFIGVYTGHYMHGGILKIPGYTSMILSFGLCVFIMHISLELVYRKLVRGDVINASLMAGSFAVGLIVLSLSNSNVHVGSDVFFGNLEGISLHEVSGLGCLFAVNSVFSYLLWKGYCYPVLDLMFGRGDNSTKIYHFVFIVQSSLTFCVLFKIIGIAMTMVYMVCVPMIIRPFVKQIKSMLDNSLLLSAVLSLLTVLVSRFLFIVDFSCSTVGISALIIFIFMIISQMIDQTNLNGVHMAREE